LTRTPREVRGLQRSHGFLHHWYDTTTGSVGRRRLALDQSMIMAGLDNALNNRQLQRWYAANPIAAIDHEYLAIEHMSF
jgi:hypothetical protein